MRDVPTEIRKDLGDVIGLLKDKTYHIDTLDKYPAKSSDTNGKGAKFVTNTFKGEKDGLYLAFDKKVVYSADTKSFLSKEEFLKQLDTLLLEVLYDGEGNILDRVGKMRAKVGTEKPNPVVFYCADNSLSHSDIAVVTFPIGLTSSDRKSKYEKPIQDFTMAIRDDGKRFALAEYSKSNGENGTKVYSIEREIMSIANEPPEIAMKKYSEIERIKRKSLGVFMSANADYYMEATSKKSA